MAEETLTYYVYDNKGVYTGESKSVTKYHTYPHNSTFLELPVGYVQGVNFARLTQEGWEVLTDYPVTLDELKAVKLAEVKEKYLSIRSDPKADTGLGFYVNSSYENLVDFQVGLDAGLLVVRDYNNQYQTVTLVEMQQIVDAIKAFGLSLKQNKWTLESAVEAADLSTISGVDTQSGWPE